MPDPSISDDYEEAQREAAAAARAKASTSSSPAPEAWSEVEAIGAVLDHIAGFNIEEQIRILKYATAKTLDWGWVRFTKVLWCNRRNWWWRKRWLWSKYECNSRRN